VELSCHFQHLWSFHSNCRKLFVSSFWDILSEGLGRIKDGMDVEPDFEVVMRVT